MSECCWQDAVRWYRAQPGNEPAVRDNYFDLPVRQAAERYARGEECAEVARRLGPGAGRPLLDLGAGNGIAGYALASLGWAVTALEPDPSDEVGAGAIRGLAAETGLPITVEQAWGERLPFPEGHFEAVHARQVLHHASDLDGMLREVARVLRPGGLLLATREHVADNAAQLQAFLAAHPLHKLYGGEMAYPLERYLGAFRQAGLDVLEVWGPTASILNFFPGTEAQRRQALARLVRGRFGIYRLFAWHPGFRAWRLRRAERKDTTPGRLYSFLVQKPCAS